MRIFFTAMNIIQDIEFSSLVKANYECSSFDFFYESAVLIVLIIRNINYVMTIMLTFDEFLKVLGPSSSIIGCQNRDLIGFNLVCVDPGDLTFEIFDYRSVKNSI